MASVRAKFRCYSKTKYGTESAGELFVFQAMYDPTLSEDQSYAKYTPSGRLEISVTNPAVTFEVGKDYYLDFTLADSTDALP